MVSFKSLFFVAASALAVLASPVPSGSDSVAVLLARDLAIENIVALASRDEAAALRRDSHGIVPLAFADITARIDLHIGEIYDACKGPVRKDDVAIAIGKIKAVIDDGNSRVRGLDGIDVSVFVQIFVKIVAALKVAFDACGPLDIITQIQISISVFLKSCFGLFGDAYYKDFCGRLGRGVVENLRVLNCADLIAVIKVHLSVNLLGVLGVNVGVGVAL